MKRPAIVLPLLAGLGLLVINAAWAEPSRDCVLEGTVKKQADDESKVYVAFHSSRPAQEGARCQIRRSEKLRFKQPAGTGIDEAEPGSKVEYRYTEDPEKGSTWKLRKVSETVSG